MKRRNSKTRQLLARRLPAYWSKDDGAVPQNQRKLELTRNIIGGGKAVTNDEQTGQLELFSETAETPHLARCGADVGTVKTYSCTEPNTGRLSENTEEKNLLATMEAVIGQLETAFVKVMANKGASGVDRQSVREVKGNWEQIFPELRLSLQTMEFQPGDIRRVWIPKSGGGQRGLGIPNVIDRIVQEAVRLVLEPLYESQFSDRCFLSKTLGHGFRPNRSCHTALSMAKQYVEEGCEWVVDIDLKDFFNKVNHQRLMARLGLDISDKRILWLISRMLRTKTVMPDGVKVSNEEGVPQGGPLSPLLSNIVLDELDRELIQRGLHFVRYAVMQPPHPCGCLPCRPRACLDDCNIYVKSQRAGHRVFASVKRFIEVKLRLEINIQKSAVAKPEERHFLGFSLRRDPLHGEVRILLSKRSIERIADKTRELTPRNYGGSMRECIKRLNGYLVGWSGFFHICTEDVLWNLNKIDAHNRRRLRAIQLKHWKRKRTIARELIKRGGKPSTVWSGIYNQNRSFWKLSHIPIVERTLNVA